MKNSQLKIMFFLLLLCAAAPLFSANDLVPSGLQNVTESVKDVFTGPLIRTILICCLAGVGVAYAFSKDNEKMKRNLIAVGIGIIIVGVASGVVEVVWNASGAGR